MSELMDHREVETCQEKLARPRSLLHENEDADNIWNVIVKRYPRAASLLGEMAVAIERAENLLHKLRTAPYTDVADIARSSTSRTSNSDESSTMLTANSGTQLSTSEDNDDMEEIGSRLSEDSSSKNEDHASSSSSNGDPGIDHREYENSDCPIETSFTAIDASTKSPAIDAPMESPATDDSVTTKNALIKKNDDPINLTSQKHDTIIFVETKELSSMEGTEKFVSDGVTDAGGLNDKKKITDVSPDRSRETNRRLTTKDPISCTTVSTEIGADRISSVSNRSNDRTEELQSTSTKVSKNKTAIDPKKREKIASGSSPVRTAITNIVPIVAENEKENVREDNNDDGSLKSESKKKTPVTILKDHAERCRANLEFKAVRNKSNSCEVECSFASYNAKLRGHSESSVRDDVAVLILRMLAEDQMEEKDMKNLMHFTNEQMRDVVALGTGGLPENAMRKLYKLCLEKNAPKPIYSVHTDYASNGVKKIAECTAFDKSATGFGIREIGAKISAAEKLYTQLLADQSL